MIRKPESATPGGKEKNLLIKKIFVPEYSNKIQEGTKRIKNEKFPPKEYSTRMTIIKIIIIIIGALTKTRKKNMRREKKPETAH